MRDGRMNLSLKLKIQRENTIDGEFFLFLRWSFNGFGLLLEYLSSHPKSIHNHFMSFFRNVFNL